MNKPSLYLKLESVSDNFSKNTCPHGSEPSSPCTGYGRFSYNFICFLKFFLPLYPFQGHGEAARAYQLHMGKGRCWMSYQFIVVQYLAQLYLDFALKVSWHQDFFIFTIFSALSVLSLGKVLLCKTPPINTPLCIAEVLRKWKRR